MDIIMIAGFCIISCIICKVLERDSGEIKILLVLGAVCIIILNVVGEITQVTNEIRELFLQADMSDDYLTIIFKGLGICYITQLSCDCANDCGESAIASQLELAGRISMLIVALPLFRSIIGIIEELLI
ncbi:MAG: stage III sporulation protein AD [Ruminococcus sp.]|nr:stage III sporulation protein AD [Ruminococcus sp.]